MLRPIFTYVLTSLILLSQVGLPIHYHFCKGSLESVSILFRDNCDDEMVPASASAPLSTSMPDCCKKALQKHCKKDDNGCCHDKVQVINQDLTAVLPAFHGLTPIDLENSCPIVVKSTTESLPVQPFFIQNIESGSGPPLYIRFHSLIYYA